MSVEILPMTADDLDAAIALWRSTDGVGMAESDEPEHLQLFLKRNPGLSLVARNGPRLVGTVLCGQDGRRGFLYHLAVIPEYRKRGLGRSMVEHCLAALAALGVLKCNILLYVHNEAGERFWKSGGWAERADLKLMQRETDDRHRDGEAEPRWQ
ncbi:MAG TPA: GNAT family N-acetyltransferase [Pirellulales bacterium]|jgi:ribosomal protein S18 acetylase RimI-like enzyme|nr:GNAT family N-acetyltransferase [Pirellulales bacterium]